MTIVNGIQNGNNYANKWDRADTKSRGDFRKVLRFSREGGLQLIPKRLEESTMEHTIISKESFHIIGVELKTTTQDGKNFVEIPQFWEKVLEEGHIEKIPAKKFQDTVLGICMDFEPSGSFSYIIGSEVTSIENTPEDMVCKMIPAGNYAVFTARGKMPGSIQETFKYIYQEWLPNSGYQRANSADFELYDERCRNAENAEVDIYVPIVST